MLSNEAPALACLHQLLTSTDIQKKITDVLYERLILGKPRRTVPRNDGDAHGPIIPEPLDPGAVHIHDDSQ